MKKVSDLDFPPLSVTKRGILPQLDNVSKSDNHNDRKRVCKNDFVINSRSDRKGSSGMSLLDGSVSLINIVLEPKSITPKYSQYIFKSKDFIEEFFRNGKGIHWDLWSTRFSELQNIKIPIPPLSEQQQIVSFLDTKTSLIDSLIEKTQRKIELLKEKRTSLINEVVTKGLNPNVEMKDSGVEWIGEIPSGWFISKVKFISKVYGRIGFRGYKTTDLVEEGEGVITLSPSNIYEGKLVLNKKTYLSYEKYHESPEIKIKSDDIVYVQRGSTIGKSTIIQKNIRK
jgi:type I restriction enzyme S subunit